LFTDLIDLQKDVYRKVLSRGQFHSAALRVEVRSRHKDDVCAGVNAVECETALRVRFRIFQNDLLRVRQRHVGVWYGGIERIPDHAGNSCSVLRPNRVRQRQENHARDY
jgi:hypothetical protein